MRRTYRPVARRPAFRWAMLLSLASVIASAQFAAPAAGQEPAEAGSKIEITTPPGQPLLPEERQRIVDAILAEREVALAVEGKRVRALQVTVEFADAKDAPEPRREQVATAVIFNYTTGQASRYVLSLATGELLARVELKGRPGPSPEEIAEAADLVRADPKLAAYVKEGAVLEGGFVVDPPEGAAGEKLRHRYLQIQILSRDRAEVHQFVTVDLTAREIAATAPPRWRR